MKWKTGISTHTDAGLIVRGIPLSHLIQNYSFSAATFFLLTGRAPNVKEQIVFDSMLVACIEHGVEVPSEFVPRVSVSVGNPIHVAVAAGILSIGDYHGGAIEQCATLLLAKTTVKEVLETGKKFSGYGHKIYKDVDPRSELLFSIAEANGCTGEHVAQARKIEKELETAAGKKLPLNIDGALAALMLELGIPASAGKALFAFARTPGMIAHALEEQQHEQPYRRFDASDVTYTGPLNV